MQLNYSNPVLQTAQLAEMVSIAEQCDGLRCDMAMLLLPEVFQRSWSGGFDYCYDKRLYDRLRTGNATSMRAQLAGWEWIPGTPVFWRNQDEARAAAIFPLATPSGSRNGHLFRSGVALLSWGPD